MTLRLTVGVLLLRQHAEGDVSISSLIIIFLATYGLNLNRMHVLLIVTGMGVLEQVLQVAFSI